MKFFLREKVLYFPFNSPFFSEKCIKLSEIFRTHVKNTITPVKSLNNSNSRLFIDIEYQIF